MLTSFFGKSNPVNFIILGFFIVLGYVFGAFPESEMMITMPIALRYAMYFLIVVFFMFLFDFIIRKNKLTKANMYATFLFVCFMVMLPSIFLNGNIIFANLFVLMALRRILSLNSDIDVEKKLLDASIWITVASFFYFWSILLFGVVFFAVLRGASPNYKKMMIPFVGFFGVFILATAYHFLVSGSFAWFFAWFTRTSLHFETYNNMEILIPVSIILALLVWTATDRLFQLSKLPKKETPNAILILLTAVAGILMAILGPEKTGAEMLFLLAPIAIIAGNYLENLSEFWFKEILLWLFLIMPIFLWFF